MQGTALWKSMHTSTHKHRYAILRNSWQQRKQHAMINGRVQYPPPVYILSSVLKSCSLFEWLQIAEGCAGLQRAMITVISWEWKPRRTTMDQRCQPVMCVPWLLWQGHTAEKSNLTVNCVSTRLWIYLLTSWPRLVPFKVQFVACQKNWKFET